jgi:hypothetical protein
MHMQDVSTPTPRFIDIDLPPLPVSAAVTWWTQAHEGQTPPSHQQAVSDFVAYMRSEEAFNPFFTRWVPARPNFSSKILNVEPVPGQQRPRAPLETSAYVVFFEDDGGRIHWDPARRRFYDQQGNWVHSVQTYRYQRQKRQGLISIGRAYLQGKGFGGRFSGYTTD